MRPGRQRSAGRRTKRPALAASALVLLCALPACGADVPTKSQADAILLKSLQEQCDVDSPQFMRNYGYPFDRFTAFFNNTILAHPERFPRVGPQDGNAEFGGVFGETDEKIPLRFSIQSYFPGPYERGSISYCPWYTTDVQIYDITVVGPKEAKVSYGQVKTLTKLTGDLLRAGVIAKMPETTATMQEALFRRYDSLGWRLENNN